MRVALLCNSHQLQFYIQFPFQTQLTTFDFLHVHVMGDTESCCNIKVVSSEWNQNGKQKQKIEVYLKVLSRLRELNVPEIMAPGFEDDLWAHFYRLPTRYLQTHSLTTSSFLLPTFLLYSECRYNVDRDMFEYSIVELILIVK